MIVIQSSLPMVAGLVELKDNSLNAKFWLIAVSPNIATNNK